MQPRACRQEGQNTIIVHMDTGRLAVADCEGCAVWDNAQQLLLNVFIGMFHIHLEVVHYRLHMERLDSIPSIYLSSLVCSLCVCV